MKKIFEWISKHFSILQAVLVILIPKSLSIIFPFLRLELHLSMWLLITLISLPVSLYILFQFLLSKRRNKFNIGDRVVPKHSSGFIAYYVVSYSIFNKGCVTVKKLDGETITLHEDSLELFDPERHAQIF